MTETKELQVTPADIRQLVELNRKMATYTTGAIVAIVATDELTYAMARLWHTLCDEFDWTINVLHTRADAVAWIRKQLIIQDLADPEFSEHPFLR
jgi:hypothetical protein